MFHLWIFQFVAFRMSSALRTIQVWSHTDAQEHIPAFSSDYCDCGNGLRCGGIASVRLCIPHKVSTVWTPFTEPITGSTYLLTRLWWVGGLLCAGAFGNLDRRKFVNGRQGYKYRYFSGNLRMKRRFWQWDGKLIWEMLFSSTEPFRYICHFYKPFRDIFFKNRSHSNRFNLCAVRRCLTCHSRRLHLPLVCFFYIAIYLPETSIWQAPITDQKLESNLLRRWKTLKK